MITQTIIATWRALMVTLIITALLSILFALTLRPTRLDGPKGFLIEPLAD